ncbi:MAG: hypothetical protein U0990_09405 [Candidatus Nanopelagicales bacterium]|nr:hypothetical protein [Candidatus Nanopelagicales bacterium]
MASFVFTEAKRALLAGELDLNAHDIRVMLVGSATTADTEEDATTISGFTTLDEFTDASYARKALAAEAVAADNANNRGEFDADDVTWTALTGDTAAAMLVFRHVTNDTDSVPIAYIDSGGFPQTPGGANLTIAWNAEGILQAT